MPGRTDEIWRRVDLSALDLNAGVVRTPAQNLATLSPLASAAQAKGVLWASPDVAAKSAPDFMQQYWCTDVFPAGVEAPTERAGSSTR